MDQAFARTMRMPPRLRRRMALIRRLAWLAEPAVLLAVVATIAGTWFATRHGSAPQRPLSPIVVALLLVANLLPAMGLLVLLARRIARARSARSALGSRGRLHVRLVALFSVLAALPTLLVVIFASLLFQYGVQFWFSNNARTVLTNADRVATTYVDEHREALADEQVAMVGDILNFLTNATPSDPRRDQYLASQFYYRKLDQAVMVRFGSDGAEQLLWGANLDQRPLEQRLPRALLPRLADGKPHVRVLRDRLESAMRIDPGTRTYLWIERRADPLVLAQVGRTNSALDNYTAYTARARTLQFRFNAALYLVSLLIVALAIWVALSIADRLVRPIGELVGAARAVAGGDLSARVRGPVAPDEVGTLANAFNRMTRRLQEQTGALENRRALMEAVLAGVSAGVISVDRDGVVTLSNLSAHALLRTDGPGAIGRRLAEVAPELSELLASGEREGVVQVAGEGGPRTLAVNIVGAGHGHVLTFDDITQQLADQRRAAWADVARRIAHEIKNPLTPIQLAAERLQRRYGTQVADESGTFERLVSTIVRQVGDIRRMIDEFSAFARMPKPVFRWDNLLEAARQAVFLQEVAHPAIRFRLHAPERLDAIVCDRRQIGQALTNVLKNAVEAIEARGGEGASGEIVMTVARDGARLVLEVADDGVGLPAERARLTEPYMTTRAKGTGLGLAIVRRIVEEHHGQLSFSDRPGGGTVVRAEFDLGALQQLAEDDATPEPTTARSR